jgi:hypothetical protein
MNSTRNFRTAILVCSVIIASSLAVLGQETVWSPVKGSSRIEVKRSVQRASFPSRFNLFSLNRTPLEQRLFSVVDTPGGATVISLPTANGGIEHFELYEASNFEPELQAKFPDIRAFSGRGITDRYATVKLSISPEGVQATVFRTSSDLIDPQGRTEIIEPYAKDGTVYAVFASESTSDDLIWVCDTPVELALFSELTQQMSSELRAAPMSSTGEVRTMRLAQSVNGEYSNYFGATSPEQVDLVLAAINATLTRVNGVFERDFGLHLNLIPETTRIIFYDPATDPYTTLSSWNNQLRDAIRNSGITIDMYDIGHMFGASGGGGNAGCIGCVCSNNPNSTHFGHEKGRGITSPADGIPYGDNFDIDYVAHEIGHQLGANHTFSYGQLPVPEMLGQDKEIGSGITIMGYAGISPATDIAKHSIDTFHATSIEQVQNNLPRRPCPAEGIVPSNANQAPVVEPATNYTIPMLTPFALTGSATDADGDAITYNWEQNDSAQNTGITVVASSANPAKTIGPNWISFTSTRSPTKYFPQLSTILAGEFTTGGQAGGGDPGMLSEALSSVPRDMNFRLTVRDNHPYVPGMAIGQTQYTDMKVSVTDLAGPFKVTAPDTAITMTGGTPLTITWLTANTNLAPVGTTHVNIRLSVNGGKSFPIVLKANTPNDGTELVVMPNIGTSMARIKVEAVGNIFLDISDKGFTVIGPTTASVGGRITDRLGRGIKGVAVTLTSPDGSERTTVTNSNGFYVFDEVPLGEAYVIRASYKRFSFTPEAIEYVHVAQTSQQDFAGTNK